MKLEGAVRYCDAHPWRLAFACSALWSSWFWFLTGRPALALSVSAMAFLLIGLDAQRWPDDHPWLGAAVFGVIAGTGVYLLGNADQERFALLGGVGAGIFWFLVEGWRRWSGRG